LLIRNRVNAGDMTRLLLGHGADPMSGLRGASLMHWACGCGNLKAAQALAEYFTTAPGQLPPGGFADLRDTPGATPLHWAAAGARYYFTRRI
jgi:ankyrin repeat protein